ncbi:MAG: tetratricopeptide repeat protein, partial [Elusimicrobia bacterium]|nr:tetratricopeptide repeat protein [Elusimicrobiota bacterium]
APPARFLAWDDAANLLDHDRWRGLSWEHVRWMWTSRHYGPWQPLSWLSWAVDYSLWGLNPQAFRGVNVALHAATSGLFVCACRRLFSLALPRATRADVLFAAVAAAAFFALHPLRVESVVWITERRDVLSGFFAVLSIWAWLAGRRYSSLVAFIGAALSKGTSVAVLPFVFAIDVSVLRRSARESLSRLIAHAVVAAGAAYMNMRGFSTGDLHALDLPVLDRILVAASGCAFYLAKTVLPAGLSPYYALPLSVAEARPRLIAGAACAALITAACLSRGARRWAAPAWLSYLAALAPVSGLLQNGRQAAADRYTYLACLPFAVVVGAAAGRLHAKRPRAALCFFAVSVLALPAMTYRQYNFWRDDATLWARAVAIEPESYLPRSNLAAALLANGARDAAVPHLKAAIRLEPRDVEARVNLGSILEERGEADEAERLYRQALSLRPGDSAAAVDFAGLRARAGDLADARRLLESVIARDPGFAPARFNLGVILLRAGRKSEGMAQLREAARLDPALAPR